MASRRMTFRSINVSRSNNYNASSSSRRLTHKFCEILETVNDFLGVINNIPAARNAAGAGGSGNRLGGVNEVIPIVSEILNFAGILEEIDTINQNRNAIDLDHYDPSVRETSINANSNNNNNATEFHDITINNENHLNQTFNCPICLRYVMNHEPTATKCGHVFCRHCIRAALSSTSKCPVCNTRNTSRSLLRLYL